MIIIQKLPILLFCCLPRDGADPGARGNMES